MTTLNEEEVCSMLLQLFYDYIELHPTLISDPSFEDDMIESVIELIQLSLNEDINFFKVQIGEVDTEDEIETIYEFIDIVIPMFYDGIYTRRSYSDSIILSYSIEKSVIAKKIAYLSSMPQPNQRTDEWYAFRNNLITASNAYKIFESNAQQNSLIYEKCNSNLSLTLKEDNDKICYVNTETTLHWGQKYEPLSLLFYEQMYKTKVGEFGCIQHNKYSFIGASPDGIIIDPTNNRYGRMLEIKNIVNREITGIPKKEYWIQMQLQMETCDLNECDFLETRFKEYETETEFLNDSEDNENNKNNENISFTKTIKGELKGIIMYFSSNDGKPRYIYKPLDMEAIEFEKWSETKIEENNELCWIKNIYWRLEEVSCVLVLRNQKWFADNIKQIENIWSIIEKERKTGEYVNRAPNKRVKKVDTNTNTPTNTIESYFNVNKKNKSETNGCLILLNKNKSTCQSLSTYENINTVIRIRTESMDETKQTYDI